MSWGLSHNFRGWLRQVARDAMDPLRSADGQVLNVQALRHTFITNLSRAGVNPKIAQSLARHTSIVLTMDHYTHLRVDDGRRALELLSSTDSPQPNTLRAAGTE